MTSSLLKSAVAGAVGVLYGCNRSYNRYKAEKSEFEETLKRLKHVQTAFANSEPLTWEQDAIGVFGRIKCMGSPVPGCDEYLSSPSKPYTFVIGPHGLCNLSKQKTDYDKLMELGFEKRWIEQKLSQGRTFDFYLFPEHGDNFKATLATWDGVFELLEMDDPDMYERVKRFKDEMQNTPFDEIESCAGFDFFETSYTDQYMTRERFMKIDVEEIRLCDVRFLFYCYLNLSEYFVGDGYTRAKNGERGSKEYLMKNAKLEEIENLRLVHLNVQLPTTEK